MISVGIIGFGYWGPNLVRNFSAIKDCQVKTVSDLEQSRLDKVRNMYPHIATTTDCSAIFNDPEIDAVIIATPISTHFDLAKQTILSGKHVFVEKPLTGSTKESLELAALAKENNRIIMVDHIYLYHGAIKKMKELISSGEIGEIQYFDTIRINLGLFQADNSVIWDLATHDLSVIFYLLDEKPYSVVATGVSHTDNNVENIAYITLHYSSGKIAHINCSWTSPVKIRQMLIGGTKKMIVYNDVEPTEKIKVYDTSYEVIKSDKILVDYRIGDIYIPKFDFTEALHSAALNFIDCITNNKTPISDHNSGIEVVRTLEAIERSIRSNGREVILDEKG